MFDYIPYLWYIIGNKGRKNKMNITIKFKSHITAEETYPHGFAVEFVREIKTTNINEIFEEAHKFENIITKGLKVVSTTTEILGITFIHDIKTYQALELAEQGIHTIEREE